MAKSTHSNAIVLLLSVALAAVLGIAGVQGYKTMSNKAKEQTAITESVVRWKRSYMALAGTQDRWEKTYKAASGIPDMLTLVSLLNLTAYNLSADTDQLVLKSDEQVTANGEVLGLTKLCLGTGQENFIVEADSYGRLLAGVEQLARRSDVFLDNISVVGDKAVPQARIGEMCLLLRSE
jgi:hypothetical protein